MVIPNLYEAGNPNIVSVGLQDVATGKSRTNLYAGLLSGASAGANQGYNGVLSNVTFFSDEIWKVMPNTEKAIFDMEFDLPQTVEGRTIVQVPLVLDAVGDASPNSSWAIIGIEKVLNDDSVLGLVSGASRTIAPGGAIISGGMVVTVFDMPRTGFKKGEKLRLKLEAAFTGAGTTNYMGFDPMGRQPFTLSDGSTTVPSSTIIQIPFKIDL